jgi:hypothetical protein
VDVVAYNVATVEGAASKLDGTQATVSCLLANGLPTDRAAVSFRSYGPGAKTERGIVHGASMQWTDDETLQLRRGVATIEVANSGPLNCTVSFDGIAQNHWWLTDPTRVPNARRAVYETIDPQLQSIQAFIAGGRAQDARNLEAAVAWLLWMLGFSVAHLGAMPKTQDAADLLMTTPMGHFAVIECTTGLLKAENKLARLHERAEAVRRKLRETNNTALRVLPAIVTTKARSDVAPDLESAERIGILVQTRENLDQVIIQTMFQPNPEQVYTQAEQEVAAALSKYRR